MSDLVTMLINDTITERDMEIAKRALKKGLSIEDVVELTDLSIEEVRGLKDELNSEFGA